MRGRVAVAAGPETMVPIAELRSLVRQCLEAEGHSEEEADVVTDVLMWAHLRGNNQGLTKIPAGAAATAPERGPGVEQSQPGGAVGVLDGQQGYGMVVLHRATRDAIARARNHGVGVVGTHHTSSSTGALGYYAEQIAQAGLVGVVLAQSPEYVAPHGASVAVFGTNPLAIGVPTGGSGSDPVIFDMTTAAAAWYALYEAREAGQEVPGDIGFNAAGEATTDPGQILDGGAIRNFTRDHKGGGLALMLELLTGALVGGAVEGKAGARNWANLVLAIDPARFGPPGAFAARVRALLARVKGARREAGAGEARLPGERGYQEAAQANAAGMALLQRQLLEQLRARAAAAAERGAPARGGASANGSEPRPAEPPAAAEASTSGAPQWHIATRLLHPPRVVDDPAAATSVPLYQTATFAQPSATEGGPYDYSRSGNPTRAALEAQIADLEGGTAAFAFASGMAALSAALRLAAAGDHVVAGDDLYGGTSRLLARVAPSLGLRVTHVDTTDVKAVRAALRRGETRLLLLESPTNPRMQVCDLRALCAAARQAGALSVVDNSIMCFLYQRPLDLGADVCMTSATKFVGGHSDVTAGLLAVREPELAQRLAFTQNAEGTALGPFDCWLLLRGLKTMDLRMERAVASAARIAEFLAAHPLVTRVNYPGLPGHPGAGVHSSQATAGGSLLSFDTGSLAASRAAVEAARLFKVTVSFGHVGSQISLPCFMSHASIPAEVRAARGLPDSLVRISVGVERADDLIADLRKALDAAAAAVAQERSAAQDAVLSARP